MKKRTALRLQVFFGYFVPFSFQAAGFFTPNWVVENGHNKGLFYQCKNSTLSCTLKVLDKATLGVEATSLILTTLLFVNSLMSILLYGPDKDDDIPVHSGWCYKLNSTIFYSCTLLEYPTTGILILSGCIRFGTLYHTEVLGASFYCCAIAGCLHFTMIFIYCCDLICKKTGEEFVCYTFTRRLYDREPRRFLDI